MKRVKDAYELKSEILKNKDKFIGKTVIDGNGFKYLIIDAGENGISAIPIENMINMKRGDLEKYLTQFLIQEKINDAIIEIESHAKEVNKIYL